MRLASLVVSFLTAVVSAAPCLAQSLEVRGAAVRIEIAHVDAVVEEGVARVVVDETFRNQTSAVQEGVYRFKLPEDAVIGSFSMWMEGKEKQGRILEARQARAVYDSIVRKRKDPGLLEQVGWREFRVNVFPIPAGDVVRMRLSYAHVVRDDLGLETLELPLPQGAGAVGDLRVHAEVKAARGLAGVDCPSHASAVVKFDRNGAMADWTGDGVAPSGPFVLRSIPRRDGFDVSLLAERPAGAESGWFVARVVPRLASPPAIGRDVVFVIDRSGSMEGRKMDQARAALVAGLATLKPGDRFDVISFSTDVTSLAQGRLLEATAENLDAARRAARELTASGGTNIADALTAALAARGADLARFSAIVFLTDGDATVGETDPDKILAAWRPRAGATRLFAFGVGADVKDFLLTKLAVEGRGDARYVREDENLEVKLGSLFDRVRTPLLLDPSLDVEGESVTALDREPRRLPDLFQGRALVVTGRYTGAGKAVLHLRGRSGGGDVKIDVPVEFPAETPARPHVAQIWAKARVERVLDDMRVLGVNREMQTEVLRLGLTHQLVTPYTSFLVVEDGVRIPDSGETARLPDALSDRPPPVFGVRSDPGQAANGPPAPPEIVDRAAIPRTDVAAQDGPVNPDEVIIPDAEPGTFNTDPAGATGGTSIGAGKGGHGGGGLGQSGAGGAGGAAPQACAVTWRSHEWSKLRQRSDGSWSAADGGEGDVRATGLSLLVLLGSGYTHQAGTYRETVKNGLKWLRDLQDSEGCFGPRTSPRFLRDQAVAGLAMTETFGMTGSRVFKEPAARALAFALRTRTPGGGWRRSSADDAALDVETTGWMVMLLESAQQAGLPFDPAALDEALADLDRATDAATGRIAAEPGGASGDACTAIGLLARVFGGRTPATDERIVKAAEALAATPPRWDVVSGAGDPAYWYFGSLAMFQIGGERWRKWDEALKTAVFDHQRMEVGREERGSWDPSGGEGRVVTTALGTLSTEVHYRYPLLGVRPDPTRPAAGDGK